MKVRLETMNSQIYAMDPQVEKIQEHNMLRLTHKGCTHILLIYTNLSQQIDYTSQDLKTGLESLDSIQDDSNIGNTKMKVRFIDYFTLQKNREYIQLPDVAGNYGICSCVYDKQSDEMIVYLPANNITRYATTVSVEMKYTIKPYLVESGGFLKGLFKSKKEEKTDFFIVKIGTKDLDFQSGDIVYTFSDCEYKFPVTKEMLGKEILIKGKNGERPRFQAAVPGMILKEEA